MTDGGRTHIFPDKPRGPEHWTGDTLCYCYPAKRGNFIVHHDLTPQEAVLRAARRLRYALGR